MIIKTPRLCNDVAFLPPQKDKPNTITCSPIIPQNEVAEYEKELDELNHTFDMGDHMENPLEESQQSKPPPLVGGIVLGAHKWVNEDDHIEKSAVVGGVKETYVDTIADSMGKAMSAEELKKMGLGDAKSVEELKKKLEKIAGGKGWKLEVFDTPQGREYRGVLLDEEDVAAESEEKKGGESAKGDVQGEDEADAEVGSEETYKDEL